MKFRPAMPDEAETIGVLVRACGRFVRTYSGIRNLPALYAKGHVFVAVDDTDDPPTIVGFAVAPHLTRKPWTSIYEIGIHPDHQRRGIGAAFIRYLTRASPWGRLRLVCDDRNTDALAFYQQIGFHHLATRRNRSGDIIHDLELCASSS